MIEKSIHDQTQNYLQRNELVYVYQSSFRVNHSTDTCLSRLTDMVLNGAEDEKHKHPGMILIDLQKAFDILYHTILLDKMKSIGFSDKTINWFHSYHTNRAFFVSLNNEFSQAGTINCGVPQGCILRLLLFLLYIHKDVTEIENVLNEEFGDVCEWFVDNKLSIHFGEDRTKCILFRKDKNLLGLNITYDNNRIKQFHMVEYLSCYLDANLSGESISMKSLKKIKLKFLYRQNKILNPKLRRLLCNSLIQPHFDYECVSWYTSVSKKVKKIQVIHNKCIRFCLKLNPRHHIGTKEFKEMNWVPTKEIVEQRVATNVFKY